MPTKKSPVKATSKELKKPAVTLSEPKKRFTGRFLVCLDPEAKTPEVMRQAKTKGLQLTTLQDLAAGNTDAMLITALGQADGIIFDRLKVAVINETGADRLKQLQHVKGSHFLSSEPERYLRAFQATSKGRGGKGISFRDTATATWGIHAMNAAKSPFTGKGIKMAILDTGFDFTHPDFAGRTIHRKSFVGTRQAKDKEGHGTHCAGIAGGGRKGQAGVQYGVAPGTRLYIGKILDDGGEGSDGLALAGIEWALEKGCQVISMSFGAPVETGSHSVVFEQVARIAMEHKCLLVAATGNESDREEGLIAPVNHPANCPSVIAVGALNASLKIAEFSCAGTDATSGQVDIAAPGDNILSTWPGGKYRRESGTSMAAPFVAGAAALLWEQYPDSSAEGIWLKLIQQARRSTLPASDIGAGLVYAQ